MDALIELSGFREVDDATMRVVQKLVQRRASRFKEIGRNVSVIKLTLKTVHEKEKSEKYEVHAQVMDHGKRYAAESTERGLPAAVDEVLNKAEHAMERA